MRLPFEAQGTEDHEGMPKISHRLHRSSSSESFPFHECGGRHFLSIRLDAGPGEKCKDKAFEDRPRCESLAGPLDPRLDKTHPRSRIHPPRRWPSPSVTTSSKRETSISPTLSIKSRGLGAKRASPTQAVQTKHRGGNPYRGLPRSSRKESSGLYLAIEEWRSSR